MTDVNAMLGRIAHLGIDHEQEAEDGNRNGRKDQALQGTLEDEPGPDENAGDVVRPPEEVRQDTPSCAEVRHAHNHAVVAARVRRARTRSDTLAQGQFIRRVLLSCCFPRV